MEPRPEGLNINVANVVELGTIVRLFYEMRKTAEFQNQVKIIYTLCMYVILI
jgi:hypothetical protein